MKRILFGLSYAFTLITYSGAYCQNIDVNNKVLMINNDLGVFPSASGVSLSGKKYSIPADLPSDRTLVLISFEPEHADVLQTWSTGLDLPNSQIPWIVTPVLPSPLVLGRFFIDRKMRSDIPDPKLQERVITLYIDRESFAKSMGFEFNKSDPYIAVIDRNGKKLGMVKGYYDEAKAKEILGLLGMK